MSFKQLTLTCVLTAAALLSACGERKEATGAPGDAAGANDRGGATAESRRDATEATGTTTSGSTVPVGANNNSSPGNAGQGAGVSPPSPVPSSPASAVPGRAPSDEKMPSR